MATAFVIPFPARPSRECRWRPGDRVVVDGCRHGIVDALIRPCEGEMLVAVRLPYGRAIVRAGRLAAWPGSGPEAA